MGRSRSTLVPGLLILISVLMLGLLLTAETPVGATEPVNHSAGEYVNLMAHTNGVESSWSMLKRGYHGTHHHMSKKHLGRYVGEFEDRHNLRESDTIDRALWLGVWMVRYQDLIAD